eukprot:827411-Alexandrium_andersonii.AAC.1
MHPLFTRSLLSPKAVAHLEWINGQNKEQHTWDHLAEGSYGTCIKQFESLCDTPVANEDFLTLFGLMHFLTRQAVEYKSDGQ